MYDTNTVILMTPYCLKNVSDMGFKIYSSLMLWYLGFKLEALLDPGISLKPNL